MSPDATALLRYMHEAEANGEAAKFAPESTLGRPVVHQVHRRYITAMLELSVDDRFKFLFYCWAGPIPIPSDLDKLIKDQQERCLD